MVEAMKERINKLTYVFDRMESVELAEYVGKNGKENSVKLREMFRINDMTDSYFKSILQALCHAGVIEKSKWIRLKDHPPCLEYAATKQWRKRLDEVIEIRRIQNTIPVSGRPKSAQTKARCDYPTGEWLSRWKPFRDPMHTILMGQR
jgi:hypothetical protein